MRITAGMAVRASAVVATCALALVLGACDKRQEAALTNAARAFADDDHDGWLDAPNNAVVKLKLKFARFAEDGDYKIVVDGMPFPHSYRTDEDRFHVRNPVGPGPLKTIQIHPIGYVVTQRFLGAADVEHQKQYTANVSFGWTPAGMPGGFQSATVPVQFTEQDAEQGRGIDVSLPGAAGPDETLVSLTFVVQETKFADPTPGSASADLDHDGLQERDEAEMARRYGFGDPRPESPRDALLVIGKTRPGKHIVDYAIENLRAQFDNHDVSLFVDQDGVNGERSRGGLANLTGVVAGPTAGIGPAAAVAIRNQSVTDSFVRTHSYYALLADRVLDAGSPPTWQYGYGNNIPGSTLAMMDTWAGVGDFAWYQHGVLMHELGHLLGLCHPMESDGTDGCEEIPDVERSNAYTVMGAPAEDHDLLQRAVDAVNRKLDYSPAQWKQLRVGAGYG